MIEVGQDHPSFRNNDAEVAETLEGTARCGGRIDVGQATPDTIIASSSHPPQPSDAEIIRIKDSWSEVVWKQSEFEALLAEFGAKSLQGDPVYSRGAIRRDCQNEDSSRLV